MDDRLQSTEVGASLGAAQFAEVTLVRQPEDHTMPAGQVFDEQRQQRTITGRAGACLLLVP